MLFCEPVEADRNRVQPGLQQCFETFFVESQSIGYNAPGVFPFVKFQSDALQVGTYQHLAARKDHQHAVGIDVGCDLGVEYPEKVFGGHVLLLRIHPTVAPAVAAGEVATQRTLPEQGAQFVPGDLLGVEFRKERQRDPFAQTRRFSHRYFL